MFSGHRLVSIQIEKREFIVYVESVDGSSVLFYSIVAFGACSIGANRPCRVVYNDAVLLPVLAGFLMLTGYALWRQKKQK